MTISISKLRRVVSAWVACSMVLEPVMAATAKYEFRTPMEHRDTSAIKGGNLKASASEVSFGVVMSGGTSSKSLTLSNIGQEAVDLATVTVSTPFTQANDCPALLVGGASCRVSVGYASNDVGTYSGSLSVGAGPTHLTIPISAVALSNSSSLLLSTNLLSMGDVLVGTTALIKQLSITNTGSQQASIGGIGVDNPSEFAQSNDCATLSPGATCHINVAFTPAQYGLRNGNLTIFEQFSGAGYSVSLEGTGSGGVLGTTSATVDMGSSIVGEAVSQGRITLTNLGNKPITGIASVMAEGDFSITGSTCEGGILAGGSCDLTVKFIPTVTGARVSTLRVTSTAAGAVSIGLKGVATAKVAKITSDVSSLTFEDTGLGGLSSTQVVTFTNSGNVSVDVMGVNLIKDSTNFAQSNTCGAVLAVGASCVASVIFAPVQVGTFDGQLVLVTTAGATTVELLTEGAQSVARISSEALDFVRTQIASTSPEQLVTVTNEGKKPLSITSIGVVEGTSSFAQSNNCSTIAPKSSCTVSVAFTPSSDSLEVGTLALVLDGGGVKLVRLTGQGESARATLSQPSFESTAIGRSTTGNATLTNTGIGPLVAALPHISGEGYSLSSTTCGTTVLVGDSCTFVVQFKPTSTQVSSGLLSIETNAGTKSVSFGTTGLQGYASISASSIDFGSQQTGASSNVRHVSITNTGTNALTFTGVGIASGATAFAQSNNCAVIAIGSSCLIDVIFAPSNDGLFAGVLSLIHDGGGVTNVDLSGVGQTPSATLSAAAFTGTPVGSTGTAQSTLTNTGTAPLEVTPPNLSSVVGTAYSFVSTTCGAVLPINGTCVVTMAFTPSSTVEAVGTLSISTAAGLKSVEMHAVGTQGIAAINPSNLMFAPRQVGEISTVQPILVTNTGTGPLTFTGVGISEGLGDFAQSNNCGLIPVGGVCSVFVTFRPSDQGTRTGSLSFLHNGDGISNVTLTGEGQPSSAELSSVSFTPTAVGGTSMASSTLTNTGLGSLTVNLASMSISAGTEYSLVSTTCGASLDSGKTCSIMMQFSPSSATASQGVLEVSTSAGVKSASLRAAGIQGFAVLNPSRLMFSDSQVGSTSIAQDIIVANSGTDALVFSGVGISAGLADFAQSNNCEVIPVGGTCTVTVSFTPSEATLKTGTLSFVHNGGGVSNVSLSGTGVSPSATLSSVTFGNTSLGNYKSASSTLTNTGIGDLTVTVPDSSSVSGAGYSFESTTCGSVLFANSTCTINLQVTPQSVGTSSGTLLINTSAGNLSGTLSAIGVQGEVSLSDSTLAFSNQYVGVASSTKDVTITNTGTDSLTVSGVGIVEGTAVYSQSNNCNLIAIGASCTISVQFTPDVSGDIPGTLAITHNGTGLALVSLAGTGVASPIITGGFTRDFVSVNDTAEFRWNVQNAASVSVICTAPFEFSRTSLSGYFSLALSKAGVSVCTMEVADFMGATLTRSYSVTVVDVATVTSSFSSSYPISGGQVTYSWDATNAVSVRVQCSGAATMDTSNLPSSGSVQLSLTRTGSLSCSATASNAANKTTKSTKNLTVGTRPSIVSTGFTTTQSTVGNPVTLNYSVTNATSATVACTGTVIGSSTALSGPINFVTTTGTQGATSGSCVITATNAYGTRVSTLYTNVYPPVNIAKSKFDIVAPSLWQSTSYSWQVFNAKSVAVSCDGVFKVLNVGYTAYTAFSASVYSGTAGIGSCTVTATDYSDVVTTNTQYVTVK